MAAIATVNGEPKYESSGESRWTFEIGTAPPVLIEQDARLTVRKDEVQTVYPISLTAELMHRGRPGDTDTVADGSPTSYRGPQPVASSERTVTLETPLLLEQVVQVHWNGAWYPAEVRRLEPNGVVHVHYRGWSDRWDEIVDRSRIQLAALDAIDTD